VVQPEQQRKKKRKMNKASWKCGAISKGLTFMSLAFIKKRRGD
jgi:hypothetical protein